MIEARLRHYRLALFLSLPLLKGCVSAPVGPACVDGTVAAIEPAPLSVLRQGRYTLVELRPEPGQASLQQQIINLRIPAIDAPTVGDGMRYVLRHSGYGLCPGSPALATLWSLPLPAVHMQLGPLPLNQALTLLAGSAWHLSVDERARQVCFIAVSPTGED